MVDKVLVREYLSSLKEDGELDYIFVLLLESMGFQILRTAQDTKGQSQYGKDVIAVGEDEFGVKHRWYFELKGFSDRDIDSNNFYKNDGVRMSLLEAKDTLYSATSATTFNSLPIKIGLVHNGIIKETFKQSFDGFIVQNFPNNDFVHWNIYKLSDLFTDNLFNAYIFSDTINVNLFKRFLIFLSVPDYDFSDIELLINKIFTDYKFKGEKTNNRDFEKLFSTLNLIMLMTWHYSSQMNNLLPAKRVINLSILKTWAFILETNKENKDKFKISFSKLISTQKRFYESYFDKTFEVINTVDGLFMRSGFSLESITYPMRSFEYLDDLIYFFRANNAFIQDKSLLNNNQKKQKNILVDFINKNKGGCCKPILDFHLISIHHVFKFFLDCDEITQEDGSFLIEYFYRLFHQIIVRKKVKGVYPYASNDLEMLILLEATGVKHEDYPDKETLLITMLMDYVSIFNLEELYNNVDFQLLLTDLDLQIARPNFESYPDFEERFFKSHLDKEYFIENVTFQNSDFKTLRDIRKDVERVNYPCRTQKAGFGFLITLAQSFYKNEPFPEEWREWFDRVNVE